MHSERRSMIEFKKFLFPAIVVLGVGAFAASGGTAATEADYTLGREPELVAVTFASAWCGPCKILQPRLSDVIPGFADKPVKFVDLDFTFGETEGLADKAAAEGLADVYPRFKGATGYTLLVDRDTGEVIDSLTVDHSKPAMRAAIARALAVAEVSGPAAE